MSTKERLEKKTTDGAGRAEEETVGPKLFAWLKYYVAFFVGIRSAVVTTGQMPANAAPAEPPDPPRNGHKQGGLFQWAFPEPTANPQNGTKVRFAQYSRTQKQKDKLYRLLVCDAWPCRVIDTAIHAC